MLIGAHSASDATFTGRIVSIADGDTVTLLDSNLQQHKIRLSGCAGAGLSGFLPFFRNWPALYREGLVDGAEWRARRFEWL